MNKTLGRFFRRKSVSETELKKDYPTNSDESDVTDDESRRQQWQRHLNVGMRGNTTGSPLDEEHGQQWEYESEYNYSVGSSVSIIDAYRESKYQHTPKFYTERDLERCIEARMKDEFNSDSLGRHGTEGRGKDRDRRDGFLSQRGMARGNEIGEPSSRRYSNNFKPSGNQPPRRENSDRRPSWEGERKKKVRKQWKQRKRAKDLSPDASDDEDEKYTVNISMDELNHIIKKNINSAVKTIVSATTKKKLSLDDSFSTETETIFSGSSSHSTDIPAGLLQKQIKAQLDSDKLRGIIKTAVAKEAQEQRRNSVLPPMTVPTINEIPPSPCIGHRDSTPGPSTYNPPQQQYTPQPPVVPQPPVPQQQPTPYPTPVTPSPVAPQPVTNAAIIPPAPPPPPPVSPQQVTFNLPLDPLYGQQNLHNSFSNRRNSVIPGVGPLLGNSHRLDDLGLAAYDDFDELSQSQLARLRNRRHTLTTLSGDGDSGLDKLEQFSNALKLLDKTLKRDDSAEAKSDNDKSDKKPDSDKESKPQEAAVQGNDSITGNAAAGVAGSLAPFQSIADQIKALSTKEKKPLEPGELDMSSCARLTLMATNVIFLLGGAGVVALGVWMMMDPNIEVYFNILNVDQNGTDFKMICYALLGVGAIGLFIAFMGCCGAMHRSKCMLTLFLILVGVLIAIEGLLGAMVVVNKDSPAAVPVLSAMMTDVDANLQKQLKISLVQKYLPDTMMGTTWDMVQIELECCGATGPEDYKISLWKNDTFPETDYPDTCCKLMEKNYEEPEPSNKLLCHFGSSGFFHEAGCYDKMVGWFQGNSTYIIAASGAIVGIEIVSFIVALIICQKGSKQSQQNQPGQTPNLFKL